MSYVTGISKTRRRSYIRTCASTILAVLLSMFVVPIELQAQFPSMRLDSAFPMGGKAGTEVDIKVIGSGLDEANRIVFSHSGITGTPKVPEKSDLDPEPKPLSDQYKVKISSEVPPGIYELRIVGPYGMSNPRAFAVGTLSELTENSSNNSRDKAMELSIGTTVNGRVDKDTMDYFKFTAKPGKRVLIICQGRGIDSRMNPALVLYDPSGREIRRTRGLLSRDPLIALSVPTEGEYVVGIYDFVYGGGSQYFYRLSVHTAAHVVFVYPPVGVPGSTSKFTVYGHNLPGASHDEPMKIDENPVQKTSVDFALPGDEASRRQLEIASLVQPLGAAIDGKTFRLQTPQGKANPVTIGYARAPTVVVEQEPNDHQDQAQKVKVPCEYVGQLYPRRDRDWVTFDAKKGDILWIEIISHRLGSMTDPYLRIEKITKSDKGSEQAIKVAQVDDMGGSKNTGKSFDPFQARSNDAAYRLVVGEDATYRILIQDLYGNPLSDPRSVYRLVIHPQRPDFRILAYNLFYPDPKNKNKVSPISTIVYRGGTALLNLQIDRLEQFDGAIEISAEGLPAGVTCHGTTLSGSANKAALIFSATEDVKGWSGAIQIVGKAKIDGKDVVRYARGGSLVWGTDKTNSPLARVTRDIGFSVVDRITAPVFTQLGKEGLVETSCGGKIELPVTLKKRGNIKGDVKFVIKGLPDPLKAKDVTIKGNGGKVTLELNNSKIEPGTYTIYLKGTAKFSYKPDPKKVKEAEAQSKRLEALQKKLAEKSKAASESAKKDKDNKQLVEAAKKAQRLAKEAEQRHQDAKKRLKKLQENSKAKDANFSVVSTPVRLRIAASPVRLTMQQKSVTLKQGAKMEIPISIERNFGFTDQVVFTLKASGKTGGVSANKLSLNKGQKQGKLQLTASSKATPGEHKYHVQASLKFNNVNIETSEKLTIRIEPSGKQAQK